MYPQGTPSTSISNVYNGDFSPTTVCGAILDQITPLNKTAFIASLGYQISLLQNYVNQTRVGLAAYPVTSGFFNYLPSLSGVGIGRINTYPLDVYVAGAESTINIETAKDTAYANLSVKANGGASASLACLSEHYGSTDILGVICEGGTFLTAIGTVFGIGTTDASTLVLGTNNTTAITISTAQKVTCSSSFVSPTISGTTLTATNAYFSGVACGAIAAQGGTLTVAGALVTTSLASVPGLISTHTSVPATFNATGTEHAYSAVTISQATTYNVGIAFTSLNATLYVGMNGSTGAFEIREPEGPDVMFSVGQTGAITALPTYSQTVSATNRDLYIDNTGKIGYVSSSIRFKEDITELTASERIYELEPVWFKYKGTTEKKMGLIAEDVDKIMPEVVYYDKNGVIDGLDYKGLIVPLLAEIKKLNNRIKVLENGKA